MSSETNPQRLDRLAAERRAWRYNEVGEVALPLAVPPPTMDPIMSVYARHLGRYYGGELAYAEETQQDMPEDVILYSDGTVMLVLLGAFLSGFLAGALWVWLL